MAPRNIKLTIHYDGSAYHGWQKQPNQSTIQGEITRAIGELTGQIVHVNGSSRTDAGVSALGQVANIRIDTPVPACNMAKALTRLLPAQIAVASAEDVDDDFDAIRSTRSKLYRYSICTAAVGPVLKIDHCWHYPWRLDAAAMNAAAGLLVGTHDFKSFASAADVRTSSIRTILLCSVESQPDWVFIDVEADGFLYNMVRNIVGTLVEVGRGRWPADRIAEILEARDRTAAGPIAPAAGLCLMWIKY